MAKEIETKCTKELEEMPILEKYPVQVLSSL